MIDIANRFVKSNYTVRLITGSLNVGSDLLDKSAKITKICSYNRSSLVTRILTGLLGFIQIIYLLILRGGKGRWLVVSNPPFSMLLPLLTKRKVELIVFDLYPDLLIGLKIFSSRSLVLRIWSWLNKCAYNRAERVITISNSMKNEIQKYCIQKRIEMIPLWPDFNYNGILCKSENPFLVKNKLQGKFIVMYSGNMGISHSLNVIFDIAKIVLNTNVHFVLIGKGSERERLKKRILQENITNIQYCLLRIHQNYVFHYQLLTLLL